MKRLYSTIALFTLALLLAAPAVLAEEGTPGGGPACYPTSWGWYCPGGGDGGDGDDGDDKRPPCEGDGCDELEEDPPPPPAPPPSSHTPIETPDWLDLVSVLFAAW